MLEKRQLWVLERVAKKLPFAIVLFLAVWLVFFPQLLENLWSNLGYVWRSKALWNSIHASEGPYRSGSEELSQAVRLFARSGKFDQCNSLGLFHEFTTCYQASQWPKTSIRLTDGNEHPVLLNPGDVIDLRYRETISLMLPSSEFRALDSITLITLMGNSTRIEQGELVGYAAVVTSAQEGYLRLLRAGVETAEWAYDFPDIPPLHAKPPISYPLPQLGEGYLLKFEFNKVVSPRVLIVSFVYPEKWHVEPYLRIWAVVLGEAND